MMDRDRIIDAAAALRELGLTPVEISPVAPETVKIGWRRFRVTAARPSMGTLVSVMALSPSQGRAEEAVGQAFEEIERLVAILSRHDTSSPLSYLNHQGSIAGSPGELGHVVQRALHYHRMSGGSFDITIKPLLDLFEAASTDSGMAEPTADDLRSALMRTGVGELTLEADTISFGREGMGITLDGIAKGYIVDMAAEVLRRHRIRDFLINAGGDIRTGGRRDDGRPWTIAVQNPAKRGEYPDIVTMTDGAVATSGSYEIHFDPEMRYHHIVDAGSGLSPGLKSSVSVTAPTALAADALATALFVMEEGRGLGLMDSLPLCDSLIISREGSMSKSTGWSGKRPDNSGG
ncbi:FAD:protein FMN transferase [Candidatus Zixiibacteriota bacterium]